MDKISIILSVMSEVLETSITSEMLDCKLSDLPNFESIAFLQIVGELEDQGLLFDIANIDNNQTIRDFSQHVELKNG